MDSGGCGRIVFQMRTLWARRSVCLTNILGCFTASRGCLARLTAGTPRRRPLNYAAHSRCCNVLASNFWLGIGNLAFEKLMRPSKHTRFSRTRCYGSPANWRHCDREDGQRGVGEAHETRTQDDSKKKKKKKKK